MYFTLKKPCGSCPFRTDIKPFLKQARAAEIAESLGENTFPCHKTLKYGDDDGPKHTDSTNHCAGALIMLEHMGRPSQMMRIAERLGFYDRHGLQMDAPVFTHAQDFIDAQEP